jgi:Pentapeptide repeats (8 copies)
MASKTELEVEKLKLEVENLQRDKTLMGRLGSIAPATTAVVAVAGIAVSVFALAFQGVQQAHDAHDKLLQQALSMATDSKGESDRRISGIYQLGNFWDKPEDELVLATTLAALVVLPDQKDEDESSVRCAAAAVIGEALDPSPTNKTKESERPRIAKLLYGTSSLAHELGSLGLITRQNNILRRTPGRQSIPDDFNEWDKTLLCKTQLAATREAIRKGYAYFDLSYTRLYAADLQGAELIGAQLVGTSLRCANLLNAQMDDTTKINKFEDDKNEGSMTDTRLANVDKGKVGQFTRAINLSEEDWREWQKDHFTISKLQRLLGTSVSVGDYYSEDFCLTGKLKNKAKPVP